MVIRPPFRDCAKQIVETLTYADRPPHLPRRVAGKRRTGSARDGREHFPDILLQPAYVAGFGPRSHRCPAVPRPPPTPRPFTAPPTSPLPRQPRLQRPHNT